jgi:thiol-disulfide isomerase/thioredoxin
VEDTLQVLLRQVQDTLQQRDGQGQGTHQGSERGRAAAAGRRRGCRQLNDALPRPQPGEDRGGAIEPPAQGNPGPRPHGGARSGPEQHDQSDREHVSVNPAAQPCPQPGDAGDPVVGEAVSQPLAGESGEDRTGDGEAAAHPRKSSVRRAARTVPDGSLLPPLEYPPRELARSPTPMPKHPCRALGAAALTALLVSACSLQPDVSSKVQPETRTSQPAPALSGTSLTGTPVALSAFHGHPVVIDFWASWCGPCRAEQDELNSLVSRFTARGVDFVGVDIRDDSANALAYVQEFRVQYPSVFDPASDDAASFNVDAPPTTLVVDRSGTIRLRELGTLVDVTSTLNSLLGGT